MKVYVGTMRLIHDGDTDVVVATTVERIEQELISKAEHYAEWIDEDEKSQLVEACNTFSTWQELGWNNEWFDLQWQVCEVHSDEHILKHAMETI